MGHLILVGIVLVVRRVPLLGQRCPGHHEGVFSLWVVSSSAAFPEPLSTQIDDLTKGEENAQKAGHHHKKGEYFFLCGPEKYKRQTEVREEEKNVCIQ